jgi:GTPase SAR1 family protein
LAAVPESLGNLRKLTTLHLSENPLDSPLLEIAEDGTAAVKAYLALSRHRSGELWKSKLLIVGEGAVGKTSLVKALACEQHDPHEPTTHGIRIAELDFDHPDRPDVCMHLSSWDFGGQDIYHATHQFFLSDRSLFLLLWNARQGWEQAKLPYWLDIIKARAPHARVIMVATHGEGRPIDLPLTDLQASFSQIVASTCIDNSTGEGINALRKMIAAEAAKLPLMGSRWPVNWLIGLEAITTFPPQYATPEDLCHRLVEVGVSDISHQVYLLRALHVLGDILYFDEDEDLHDTVILRPQWVNGYVARVLDSPEVAEKRGLLTRLHERQLWSDLELSLRDRFLLLMEKFDLSYRITDDSSAASLVVERLPWDSPNYLDRWDDAMKTPGAREIRLRYQLSTFPPGVPTWFIAREHRFTTNTHWRNGALLQHVGDRRVLGLIRADRKDKTVDLAVRGPVPQFFFSVLQDGFESTLRRYQGLEITRLVPCKCAQGDGIQLDQPCRHLYQYDPLLRRVEQNIPEAECELSFSKVSVADLLFGIAPTTTEKLMSQLDQIHQNINDFRAETAWVHREFLKNLRRNQARLEALCPTIFTLIPSGRRVRRPGIHRLELRLYCEQPGAFHSLSEAPYIIDQPTRWLVAIRPYLATVLSMLKHAAPLVGPVLGLTAEHMAKQLTNETKLMTVLIDQLPNDLDVNLMRSGGIPEHIQFDADYRALYALLHQLDPTDRWAGLSRTYTPEGDVLWLCRDHAEQ